MLKFKSVPYRKSRLPVIACPLVTEFFRLQEQNKVSRHDIAVKAGLSFWTISKWRNRTTPDLHLFEAAVNALGYELVIRPKRTNT